MVTSRWPLTTAHEFLDDEIQHLAVQFDRIVVAPMRPKGPLVSGLPLGVAVDYTLAEHLEHTVILPNYPSRQLTAAARVALPNRYGFGCTRANLLRDGWKRSWIRASLLRRADSTSGRWMGTSGPRPRPRLERV